MPGRAAGRAVLRLGSATADTSRPSRTRPLHEAAHCSRQFIVQLARTSEHLAVWFPKHNTAFKGDVV
jgi:hypothetical protein